MGDNGIYTLAWICTSAPVTYGVAAVTLVQFSLGCQRGLGPTYCVSAGACCCVMFVTGSVCSLALSIVSADCGSLFMHSSAGNIYFYHSLRYLPIYLYIKFAIFLVHNNPVSASHLSSCSLILGACGGCQCGMVVLVASRLNYAKWQQLQPGLPRLHRELPKSFGFGELSRHLYMYTYLISTMGDANSESEMQTLEMRKAARGAGNPNISIHWRKKQCERRQCSTSACANRS